MQNLGQFLEKTTTKYQERVAYEIKRGLRTQRFTYAKTYDLALKTATFLSERGLKKSDKVAIWSSNIPEYPILYFGCWLLGIVAVPIDVRTNEETVKLFLSKATCKLGFKGKFIPGSFGKLVNETLFLEDLISLVSRLPGLPSVHLEGVASDDLAEIAFTSGTTGTPKGVMLTHRNFISDVETLLKTFPFKKEYRTLSLLPLSHAFEQVVGMLAPFASGMKVVYIERINRLTILRTLRKSEITSVALVPQALQLLMNGIENQIEKKGKQKIWNLMQRIAPYLPIIARRLLFREVYKTFGQSLKFFGCGSAPLNLKLAQKWENLGIEVFEGYGATETTAALTINRKGAKRLGSVGKVLACAEVKIDEKTNEIKARGATISPGYYKDPKKTKEAFCDGWYYTGDVGKLKNGFLYITGRQAFRIVLPNGQKVYPEDVERYLNIDPRVIESCVVGVKTEEGEKVHAAIITKSPKKLDEIITSANEKLSSHQQILEWSLWKEEDFPRTPFLKIDRKKVTQVILSEAPSDAAKSKDLKPKSIQSQDKLITLISQIAKLPHQKINENSTLATDLKLDSLQRVELLSLIEQELAVAIPETAIDQRTTVADLRKLIQQGEIVTEEIPINKIVYSPKVARVRVILQNALAFPLHSFFAPMKVEGLTNLKNLSLPAIFYFNHIGIMDGVCVLRVLPQKIREKLVIAVKADLWKDYRKPWVEIIGGAFPFDKKNKIKASLELMGEFLDRDFSVLMAPEGTFTRDGKLLEFKMGAGFMAIALGVPVVPIKIDPSYNEIFPPIGGFFENIPKKRKKIWIKIGAPLAFSKDTAYNEATKKMQQALEML